MEAKIICFSQTGNTRKIATTMAETFRENGYHIQLVALKDACLEDVAGGDLLGVGSPCFSSRAPRPVIQFVESLPQITGMKTFVYATCGGAPGRTLFDIGNALRKKGADLIGGALFRGEVHHPAPSLIGRFPGRPNTDDLDQARMFAKTLVTNEWKSRTTVCQDNGFVHINRKLDFYGLVASLTTDKVLRAILPAPKLEPVHCDGCHLCLDECPIDNIQIDQVPTLGSKCIRCYRCYTVCPHQAFRVNWGGANQFLACLYNRPFIRRFGDVKPEEKIY